MGSSRRRCEECILAAAGSLGGEQWPRIGIKKSERRGQQKRGKRETKQRERWMLFLLRRVLPRQIQGVAGSTG